ncbi:fungalysin metallopeptidase (M36) domain-containing protein [Trichoderma breve]|uniref:Extracellular metalloproteinase n=1 Tax=Trichoderma breve TaxID=2034170 RepID=A0A9W9B474_9HYPO|nr:fungalysin metallopeptidase (M36) domain-containing protein [Trichoderma breve]KAJ4855760.1 fungalysin metallopeptidase (M36) domain-containing protein [Trichoderma breve]
MKSAILLGLTGLAANVHAHPAPKLETASGLAKRGIDISKYSLPSLSDYTPSTHVEEEASIQAEGFKRDYVATATRAVKRAAPNAEFRVVPDHYVDVDGIGHVHFKQTAHGIDIDNADFKVNIGRNGRVFSHGNSFFAGKIPAESPLTKRDFSDPTNALKGAVDILGLPIQAEGATAEAQEGTEKYTLKGTSGAVSDPEARLVYLAKEDGTLSLTWRVETDVVDNWLLTYIDAATNKEVHGVVDYVSDFATVEVFPWGLNDPTEGDRKTFTDPWRVDASPFTWFGDGTTNYTTTRGNNAIAQVNPNGGNDYLNNYRPTSATRAFEYPFSLTQTNPTDYRDASITQLFYTANKYHDLLYVLGFNEVAGNFQANNNGKGGKGNDFVILNAQDGSGTNNANFATPADGSNGRMRMYIWTVSTPRRDGSLEEGIVIHEYTHGLSTRLTGGPANSGCLSGVEAGGMGEGWGDFYATAIRLKAGDTRATDYPMGAWADNNPKGIRQYPYSTSLTTNPLTYKSVNSQNEVHSSGTTWASILYEVLWNLIDKHGKNDAEFPTFDSQGVPTDGKFLALKLVLNGLALQPCTPTFVSARDAILDADRSLTGGENLCELWTAFAKRGLGSGARYSASARTESFTIPSGVC